MPARMQVLYVTTPQRTGGWLAEALAGDSAAEVELEEVAGATAGMARLRDQAFDAVLVSHEPGLLDALHLVEGLRAGGADEPVVVLGAQSEQEMAPLCYETGADAYVCVNTATTRALIWVVARAIERQRLIRENRRLQQLDRQRLVHEHQEVDRLLAQQRALLADFEELAGANATTPATLAAPRPIRGAEAEAAELPESLVNHYRELLRAHVIMGSGNLGAEMSLLADLFASARIGAQQTMLLHLQVLEELIRGLGTRSARHVMTRADLLVVEVLVHLAENYRRRYLDRRLPAQQLVLPGFDAAGAAAA
jgi:DNA-binding response OmpR family regulator